MGVAKFQQIYSSAAVSVLQRNKVLCHVTQAVEVAAYTAEVRQRGQESVQPQAIAEVSVFGVRLAQLGISFSIGRQAYILTQSTCLLNEVHVCHDLGCHLAKPLSIHSRHCYGHKKDEDLEGFPVIQQVTGMIHCIDSEVEEGTS